MDPNEVESARWATILARRYRGRKVRSYRLHQVGLSLPEVLKVAVRAQEMVA
jgi:hypothetical protein